MVVSLVRAQNGRNIEVNDLSKNCPVLVFCGPTFFIMKVMIHTIHTIHTWVFTEKTVQDWRIGAFHFEDVLLDYDVAMNYGNWVVVSEATSKTWAEEMKSFKFLVQRWVVFPVFLKTS